MGRPEPGSMRNVPNSFGDLLPTPPRPVQERSRFPGPDPSVVLRRPVAPNFSPPPRDLRFLEGELGTETIPVV